MAGWRFSSGESHDHVAGEAGDFVHFFVQRHAFLQVFELHGAADFREDGEGVRIPLDHHLSQRNLLPVFDLHLGAVNDCVALFFTALVVDHGDRTIAVHYHQVAFFGADG